MIPGIIKNHIRIIGKSQGYIGLAVRDARVHDTVNGPGTPVMETAWMPDPAELERIAAGEPVVLRILGTAHPPVMVEVGEVPK